MDGWGTVRSCLNENLGTNSPPLNTGHHEGTSAPGWARIPVQLGMMRAGVVVQQATIDRMSQPSYL